MFRWINQMAMIVMVFMVSTSLMAAKVKPKIVIVPEGGQSYQGIFVVTGQAEYPYPIKTDRINQMMAKRLAVHQGMLEMSKHIDVLRPYLDQVYQLSQEDGFVQGAYVENIQMFEDYVSIELQYLFVCRKDQFQKMKKALGHKVDFEAVKTLVQSSSQLDQGYEVTRSYWDKLVTFARRMSDE